MRKYVLKSVLLALLLAPANAFALDEKAVEAAKHIVLLDGESGIRLFAKNADELVQPGNFAKLMSMVVLGDAMLLGKITFDTRYKVSEDAWRRGGALSRTSAMYVPLNAEVSVRDLLTGVATVAANDGILVLAEGLAGNEATFTQQMNETAERIELKASKFANATGAPAPEQITTANDLATLARYIAEEQSYLYALFQTPEISWSNITQRNRNPLVGSYAGADGLMLNFVAESGHGAIVSAMRDNRRVLAVVLGVEDRAKLLVMARNLLDWGFDGFEKRVLFEKQATIACASVYGGEKGCLNVGLPQGAVEVLLPKGQNSNVRAVFDYNAPVVAPVKRGDAVGKLGIWRDDVLQTEVVLVAQEDIAESTFFKQALDALWELVLQANTRISAWMKA